MPACLLVPDLIRAPMARLLKRAAPRLRCSATARSLRPIRSASARSSEAQHERQTLHRPHLARSPAPGARGASATTPSCCRPSRAPTASRCWRWRPRACSRSSSMSARAGRDGCATAPARARRSAAAARRAMPSPDATSSRTSKRLAMSTLSFQDYVRERMLKRRQAELKRRGAGERAVERRAEPRRPATARRRAGRARVPVDARRAGCATPSARDDAARRRAERAVPSPPTAPLTPAHAACADDAAAARREQEHDQRAALDEGPDRGALRRARLHGEAAAPARRGAPDAEAARLRLLAGADPQARRRPAARRGDETAWAASVLERNLLAGEARGRARGPGRRVRAGRRHRRRQDHDHRQDRRRLRRQARRRATSA